MEKLHTPTLARASDERDVALEARYTHLNARGFVRGENELDQWVLLVNEAWKTSRLQENEHVKAYLATMLYRFMKRHDLFDILSGFDFYRHAFGLQKFDDTRVQDVADMSLQYVAFFPERSTYRHEPRSLEHTANMGVSLYQQLANKVKEKDSWIGQAYQAMSVSYGQAVVVLRSVCPRFLQKKEAERAFVGREACFATTADMRGIADDLRIIDFVCSAELPPPGARLS